LVFGNQTAMRLAHRVLISILAC